MNQLVLPIVLPLLSAFLLPVVMRAMLGLGLWIGPLVLGYNLWTLWQVWTLYGGESLSLAVGGFAPPLGINLYADPLAMLFAATVQLMGLLLWPFRIDGQTARRQSLTLLLIAACTGMALAGDLFNLYVWYELAAVASFGLIVQSGSVASYAASLRYLLLSGLGSVLALLGITLIYAHTGTLNFADLANLASAQLVGPAGIGAFMLLLLGLGVKAELFPVNSWVPAVYATAPARVSALLAGVVSKLAVLALLRLLLLLFPQPEVGEVLVLLGILGVVSGELAAWQARDLRRVLAYSSIGQLGMIFIAFSMPGGSGVVAGLALVLHHLVVKSGMFLLSERWGGSLERLRGAGLASPLGGGLFVLFALSLIGVPPLPGFWAKLLLLQGLAAQAGHLYPLAMGVFLVGTVVEAGYLLRIVGLLFGKAERPAPRPPAFGLVLSSMLGASLIGALLLIDPLAEGLQHTASVAVDRDGYIARVLGADS